MEWDETKQQLANPIRQCGIGFIQLNFDSVENGDFDNCIVYIFSTSQVKVLLYFWQLVNTTFSAVHLNLDSTYAWELTYFLPFIPVLFIVCASGRSISNQQNDVHVM